MTYAADVPRPSEFWDWLAVALFLLLTVDMLTTLAAAHTVGVDAEVNPVMQWALEAGVLTVVAVNLAALCFSVACFAVVTDRIDVERSRVDRAAGILTEIWLGLLIAAGLAVFANNLSVIVFEESLL